MITSTPYLTMSGLGLSLKPPSWLLGPLERAVSQARISVTVPSTTVSNRPVTPAQTATNVVESNIPGGWFTVIGVGLLAALVLPRMLRGR